MYGMLFAKFAILGHFNPVRVVLFVFHRIIVSLFAFRASKRNLRAHFLPSGPLFLSNLKKGTLCLLSKMLLYVTIKPCYCQCFYAFFSYSFAKRSSLPGRPFYSSRSTVSMMYFGRFFVSIYASPTYSPIMPIAISWRPPRSQIDIIMLVHPACVCPMAFTTRE